MMERHKLVLDLSLGEGSEHIIVMIDNKRKSIEHSRWNNVIVLLEYGKQL